MAEASGPFDREESFREESSAQKDLFAEKVVGTWHITGMEMWDADYFNMETQAYIRIGKGGTGDLQFGLVTGSIDGYVEEEGTDPRFTCTWEGSDEMNPVSGGGWLRLVGKDQAEGVIKIYRGDRSRFQARRAF
jgi:hypothetical protein